MAYEVTMHGGYGRRDKHTVPDIESAKSHIKEKMATKKYLGYDTKPLTKTHEAAEMLGRGKPYGWKPE